MADLTSNLTLLKQDSRGTFNQRCLLIHTLEVCVTQTHQALCCKHGA